MFGYQIRREEKEKEGEGKEGKGRGGEETEPLFVLDGRGGERKEISFFFQIFTLMERFEC